MNFDELDDFYVSYWGVKQAEQRIDLLSQTFDREKTIAWLLRAVTFIDLTTLGGDDTASNVSRLCLKARNPILDLLLHKLEVDVIKTAAVCVYPSRVADAKAALSYSCEESDSIPVAAVATGFPSGQYSLATRLTEISYALEQGATEIDVVIDRSLVICGQWKKLYYELVAMKTACGTAHMKTILAVGELPDLTSVYKASMVAMYAGSDFIKTSTGKETVNATIPVGIVMARAIHDYYLKTTKMVGLKAAGGLRTAEDAISWLVLVYDQLGYAWLSKDYFRIGASSLLTAIEAKLYKLLEDKDPVAGTFLAA